jgi:hypothetical protein
LAAKKGGLNYETAAPLACQGAMEEVGDVLKAYENFTDDVVWERGRGGRHLL